MDGGTAVPTLGDSVLSGPLIGGKPRIGGQRPGRVFPLSHGRKNSVDGPASGDGEGTSDGDGIVKAESQRLKR